MKKILFWFQNARWISLPQSMIPALVAAFLATKYADFKWYLALFCVLGVAFAHLCLNMFDDYFDFYNSEQGDRTALAREGFRARTLKCQFLVDGTVSPKKWLLVTLLYGLIACLFGLPVLLIQGISIIYVVIGVLILGIFYSAPPLKLGYHGLGELIIGLIFGPGVFIGTCLGSAGEIHLGDIMISCAVGLFVVNILYVHSIMDYAADQKAGKKTLAWLMRNDKGRYIALACINFIPYIIIILGVIFREISVYYLIVFLTLPWSYDLFKSMLAFKKDPFGKVEKKAWYGNFAMWDMICENKLDWFMLRWYLAQKIDTIFCLLCIIVSIILMIISIAQ